MSDIFINDHTESPLERRKAKRRVTPDRRNFQRFEPGKIITDRRVSNSDRRACENIDKLSI